MGNRSRGRPEASVANDRGRCPAPWPGWARVAVSAALLFHMGAVLGGALGVPPSSLLEQSIAEVFTPYYDLVDLGYSYRYYAEPPPTPVVTATLEFGDGRPEETVRLPGREVAGPRMRHQRQLALANALFMDVQEAKERTGDSSKSRLARAYARHLCLTRPRLPERDAPSSASSDSRAGTGARGDRGRQGRRGSTCSPSRCSPRPSGSETTRATAFE